MSQRKSDMPCVAVSAVLDAFSPVTVPPSKDRRAAGTAARARPCSASSLLLLRRPRPLSTSSGMPSSGASAALWDSLRCMLPSRGAHATRLSGACPLPGGAAPPPAAPFCACACGAAACARAGSCARSGCAASLMRCMCCALSAAACTAAAVLRISASVADMRQARKRRCVLQQLPPAHGQTQAALETMICTHKCRQDVVCDAWRCIRLSSRPVWTLA